MKWPSQMWRVEVTCDEIGAIYIDSCDSLLHDIINAVLSKIFFSCFWKKENIDADVYIYIYLDINSNTVSDVQYFSCN